MSSIEIYTKELNQYKDYINSIENRDFFKEIEILSKYEHLREVHQKMFLQESSSKDNPCLPRYDGLIIPLKLKEL